MYIVNIEKLVLERFFSKLDKFGNFDVSMFVFEWFSEMNDIFWDEQYFISIEELATEPFEYI
jgi:hypothetical protein